MTTTPARLNALSELFRTLSDPTRLRLLVLVADGERNVTELQALLGNAAQPHVSHHLGLLRAAGLVAPRRDGKRIYYGLADGVTGPGGDDGDRLTFRAGGVVVRLGTRDAGAVLPRPEPVAAMTPQPA